MKTYIKHRIYNVIDIKKLTALEFLDFEGKYKDYVEEHDFWEVCYVYSGNIRLVADEAEKVMKAGDIAFIPPNSTHSYHSDDGNANKVFVVCFECLSQCMKALGGMTFALDDLKSCMEIIINEYKHTFYINDSDLLETLPHPNFGGEQAIILQLEYLLINLLRTLSAQENDSLVFLRDESFYADLVDVIIEYFTENAGKRISLDEICNKVNYSRSFVCKIFKEQTGESLFTYFNKIKIEQSKKLLVKEGISVGEISQMLGFNESKYFGAMFKKHTGMSPGEYRKKHNKKERM